MLHTEMSKLIGKQSRADLNKQPQYLTFTPNSIYTEMSKPTSPFFGLSVSDRNKKAHQIAKELRNAAKKSIKSKKGTFWRENGYVLEFKGAGGKLQDNYSNVRKFMSRDLKPWVRKHGSPDLKKFLFGTSDDSLVPEKGNAFMHLGHTSGGALKSIDAVTNNQALSVYKDLNMFGGGNYQKEVLRELRELRYEAWALDGDATLIRTMTSRGSSPKGGVVLKLEIHTDNKSEGSQLQGVLNKVKDIFTTADLLELEGSPSFLDMWEEYVESVFLEKRMRNRKYVSRGNFKVSGTNKRAVRKLQVAGASVGKRKNKQGPGIFANLLTLKNIININMHDVLQDTVMGGGSDPEILNYRTGRFARSMQVVELFPQPPMGLLATIDYQRDPYRVFSVSGHLYKPGRDPEFLAGEAMRQILNDLALDAIRLEVMS